MDSKEKKVPLKEVPLRWGGVGGESQDLPPDFSEPGFTPGERIASRQKKLSFASKQTIRQVFLEKRNQLTDAQAAEASRKIAGRFFALEEVRLAERFGLYAAVQKEAATDKIFAKAHALRQEIYYPAVDRRTKTLCFYRVRSIKDLKPGFAGIPEPSGNPLHDLNYLNLIVVPGIAFDRQGNRLGRGEGYYDRLLKDYRGLKIGLAYEFQIVDALPTGPGDQRMDWVITEERVLKWT